MAASEDGVRKPLPPPPPGYRYIFVPKYWHKKLKRWIFPKKAKCFCFLVPEKRARKAA